MPFTLPQPGIFARGTGAYQFLEFDLLGVHPRDAVAASLNDLRALAGPEPD